MEGRLTKQGYLWILGKIESDWLAMRQWHEHPNIVGWMENVMKYLHRVEVLVELLEVNNCGSVGGFDRGQKHPNGDMKKRIDWLKSRVPAL